MDYSAHDSDLPGGGDPWASSPQHNRQSFGQPPTSDIPSSPLQAQSPYGQGGEQYGYIGEQDVHVRPNTASSNGDHAQPPQAAGQDAPQSQQAPQAQQQAPTPGQQPQRYHGTRPQRQQQHYKLQAKVTGLERNGKKDSILRFDVYVCVTFRTQRTLMGESLWKHVLESLDCEQLHGQDRRSQTFLSHEQEACCLESVFCTFVINTDQDFRPTSRNFEPPNSVTSADCTLSL
jgi:hypothetical protein